MTNLVIKFLTVSTNPAKDFALWMSKRREELNITLETLQERTGIKKQHLSTLERAAPHALTGKPVTPKRPTVEKIAKGLEVSPDIALAAAGYAVAQPVQQSEIEAYAKILAENMMASGFDDLEDEDLRQAVWEDALVIAKHSIERGLREQEKRRKKEK